ncbi:MAG: hypothetical protein Harvfovirus1_68 [Harvfovirus sp.]|uniref:Uncharacterized protein n=1 Tax=Harvfovirus sp. TaxID=2487768 RepID=A0A3G5A3N7_9VIRU|nr:MAG: hypothetical protein Harvfovirus1_68 [Harvfovirus sp.]
MKLTLFTNENKNFPAFFYFDYDTTTAHFYYKLADIQLREKDISQIAHVAVKNMNETLFMCIDKKYSKVFVLGQEEKEDNLSIMKSHLQKCVRRGERVLAMETGKYMLEAGQTAELLRRLFIICLEDTILNKEIVTLTWLMVMANKKYQFDDNINSWILGFIALISEVKYFDPPDFSGEQFQKKNLMSIVKKLDPMERDIIMSLVIRISYGGMGGDLKMLNNFISRWLARFSHNDDVYEQFQLINPLVKQTIDSSLSKNSMLLAAFDFHCTNIIKMIQKKVDLDDEQLRKLIWNHSSSTNFRIIKELDPDETKLWIQVQPHFKACAEFLRGKIII